MAMKEGNAMDDHGLVVDANGRIDIYATREKNLKEGKERWQNLTKDWSTEDREWAEQFWSAAGMPWA